MGVSYRAVCSYIKLDNRITFYPLLLGPAGIVRLDLDDGKIIAIRCTKIYPSLRHITVDRTLVDIY